MITKKDIPFNLLKRIEAIAQSNLDLIKFVREDNTYYCFVETDEKSKNYFKIFIDGSKQIAKFDKSKLAYKWKPSDETNSSTFLHQGTFQDVIKQFETWAKLIRDINNTPSLHDDNFTKHYSDFYFEEFKIVDENADISPFNPEQQDLVELYLDSLANAINNSEEKIEQTVKTELLSEINEIKSSLPTSTKAKVMKGITKVFGKLYKVSKAFAKDIITEAKKHLIKKLIELGIEYGPKLLEAINKIT